MKDKIPVNNPALKGIKKNKPIRKPYEKNAFQSVIVFCVVFCTVFSFLPLLITVINSMKTQEQVSQDIFSLPQISTFLTAIGDNFGSAWGEIGPYFFRTVAVALVGAFFETLLSAVLAYILCFKDFYFKKQVFILFIAVLLIPSIIGFPILVPLIRDTFHLGDTYFGYLLPTVGGCQVSGMFLFKTFFSQQPKSLYECASAEGANDFHVFFRVTVPLARPIILYFFVGAFSGIYNDYLWASLILDNNLTMMTKMYSLVDSQSLQYGAMYALYIISSVPLIVTTVISMKYFKSGEFAAGLKL